ncbi:GNAT family protein [Aliisedimentitalea scapharcae]|uniref:GNAT family protein n=1 Tax=Aliisedimentitalea scapharcae TaxID=1524259 RepID=A0ABZ2XWA8_9RHOB
MTHRINAFGQPIGQEVPNWHPRSVPDRKPMRGQYCDLIELNPVQHADDLFTAFQTGKQDGLWTYMSVGPFSTKNHMQAWLVSISAQSDPVYYAILDRDTGRAIGVASYMRIKPDAGSVEVGGIAFSPLLQCTRGATEAMFLMMRHVFDDLGYRRYEWKCDALNEASRRAAERLGFSYDGLFEQALVYKGRNRDTAWYSILDRDWPRISRALCLWLDPQNFDEAGRQRERLTDMIQIT